MKKLSYLFIFLSLLNFSQEDKFILSTVAFYNVENLFDAVDDPKTIGIKTGLKKEHGQKKYIKRSLKIFQE